MNKGLEAARLAPRKKRPSMRKAIDAMCKHCIYDENGTGNWRQQVEACTAPKCPLFDLRPVSSGNKGEEYESSQRHAQWCAEKGLT